MHVLALLLFDAMTRGDFAHSGLHYADYIAHPLNDEHLWPTDLSQRYDQLTNTAS